MSSDLGGFSRGRPQALTVRRLACGSGCGVLLRPQEHSFSEAAGPRLTDGPDYPRQCNWTAKDAGTNGFAVGAQRIPRYFQVRRSGGV